MSIPSQPQPFTNTEMVNICKSIDTNGSEPNQLRSIIAYVRQSHEKPSLSITRIDCTLKSNISEDNKQQLVKIRDCLQRYTSQFSRESAPSAHQDAAHQSATTQPHPAEDRSAAGAAAAAAHSAQYRHTTFDSDAAQFKKFWCSMQRHSDSLSPQENPEIYLPFSAEHHRFPDISCRQATNVATFLHANRITISGRSQAIACQYPLLSQLESYMGMLFENRTPLLCVLSSVEEIEQSQADAANFPFKEKVMMTSYFTVPGQYGSYQTQSVPIKKIDFGSDVRGTLYHLSIKDRRSGVSITIPTVHVQNWPDHGAMPEQALKNLTELIKTQQEMMCEMYKKMGSRALQDPKKILPVVHCRAGVGRTGTLIAAMAMANLPQQIPLRKIITDMRESRNGVMVQTKEQMESLTSLCQQTGRNLE